MMTRRAAVLVLAVLAAGPAGRAVAAEMSFASAPLVIVTATGRHRFRVEVAKTPAQMEQGLMFRRRLAPDSGMLFEFDAPTVARMWMHNTLIPLDMLFVDGSGRIVNIAANATPMSDAVIAAAAPVRAVVELPGGTAARLDAKPGDRVLSPFFGNLRQP
ncbi:MAG TPA: DUF192 domain-containing protein [Stellaceae bacterium]|nr:DUF192 domain-containing protein [Stellaceae bacterium]